MKQLRTLLPAWYIRDTFNLLSSIPLRSVRPQPQLRRILRSKGSIQTYPVRKHRHHFVWLENLFWTIVRHGIFSCQIRGSPMAHAAYMIPGNWSCGRFVHIFQGYLMGSLRSEWYFRSCTVIWYVLWGECLAIAWRPSLRVSEYDCRLWFVTSHILVTLLCRGSANIYPDEHYLSAITINPDAVELFRCQRYVCLGKNFNQRLWGERAATTVTQGNPAPQIFNSTSWWLSCAFSRTVGWTKCKRKQCAAASRRRVTSGSLYLYLIVSLPHRL